MLFPLGGPVPESEIVDRENFISSIQTRLKEGQSVMLAGPRRIGKTSLANEVLRQLKKQGLYTASVDFFRSSDRRKIAESIIDSCLENRTGIRKTLDAVWDQAKLLTGSAKIAVKLKDLEFNLGFPKKEIDAETLLEYALNLPETLSEKDNKRTVVLFDEFQDAGQIAGHEIYKQMRSIFQLQRKVSYLFLGSKESMMRSLFADKKHAFYRFATVLPIPEIPEAAWKSYISRKFVEYQITIGSEASLEEIIHLTGGHPQDTMLVCSEAYYTLLESNDQRVLTNDIVKIAYERAMASLTPVFDEILDDYKKPLQRDVSRRLAVGESIYGGNRHPNEIKRAIDQLLTSGTIEREKRGKYRFAEPMLQEYILRNS